MITAAMHELNNLAGEPEWAGKLTELKTELAAWTKTQGDQLQPHRQPYLIAQPLPDLLSWPREKQKASRRVPETTNEP